MNPYRENLSEVTQALRNIAAVGHARDNVERANDKLDACIEWANAAIAKAEALLASGGETTAGNAQPQREKKWYDEGVPSDPTQCSEQTGTGTGS